MRSAEFVDLLLREDGVLCVEPMSSDIIQKVAECEASVDTVTGGMMLENIGLFQCIHHPRSFIVFCDGRFRRPSEITIRMIDTEGTVIGHDVPSSLRPEYESRNDIYWVSDGFVMYPRLIGNRDAKMVMGCSTYRAERIPEEISMRLFYPSVKTAELINGMFGVDGGGISSAIMGVDGLED